MEKPAASKITIELGTRGEDVVTLPPRGVNSPDAFRAFVLLTWLSAAAAVGVALVKEAGAPSRTPSDRAVMMLWLSLWGLGVLVVGWVWVRLVARMFGWQRAIFDYDRFVLVTSLFGLKRQRVFRVDLMGEFAAGPSPVAGMHTASGIVFRHAGRRISLALGRSPQELEWLAGELNRLPERHRR